MKPNKHTTYRYVFSCSGPTGADTPISLIMKVFMAKKTRCQFSDEFKADTVGQVIDQAYPVPEAALHLGIEQSMLDS